MLGARLGSREDALHPTAMFNTGFSDRAVKVNHEESQSPTDTDLPNTTEKGGNFQIMQTEMSLCDRMCPPSGN